MWVTNLLVPVFASVKMMGHGLDRRPNALVRVNKNFSYVVPSALFLQDMNGKIILKYITRKKVTGIIQY